MSSKHVYFYAQPVNPFQVGVNIEVYNKTRLACIPIHVIDVSCRNLATLWNGYEVAHGRASVDYLAQLPEWWIN